ncbi:MAG TPA: hypothetical protein VF789_24595 [Thermoanaerobaculia bacterium]
MPELPHRLLQTLGVVAVLLSVSLLPARVEADPPCPYTSFRQTAVMAGYGYTCTDATNDLRSKVDAAAAADCGFLDGQVILPSLVITEECHAYSGSQVEVKGYLQYRCMYC